MLVLGVCVAAGLFPAAGACRREQHRTACGLQAVSPVRVPVAQTRVRTRCLQTAPVEPRVQPSPDSDQYECQQHHDEADRRGVRLEKVSIRTTPDERNTSNASQSNSKGIREGRRKNGMSLRRITDCR